VSDEERDQQLDDLVAEMREQVEAYCRESGYRLNPDSDTVERIIRGLARRKQKTGEAYCPCRVATGDPEKDKDIICPCIYHQQEIAADGICHCFLFCSPEYEAEYRQDR